jgi:hypothetical protein
VGWLLLQARRRKPEKPLKSIMTCKDHLPSFDLCESNFCNKRRVHFKRSTNVHPLGVEKNHKSIQNYWDNPMAHPVWSEKELLSIAKTHVQPSSLTDRTALGAVKVARWAFDTFTLFKWGPLTEKKVLNRAIFLETVAAVPGMVSSAGRGNYWRFLIYHGLRIIFADRGYASALAITKTNGS